jgi:hypothetical protein
VRPRRSKNLRRSRAILADGKSLRAGRLQRQPRGTTSCFAESLEPFRLARISRKLTSEVIARMTET